MTRLLQWVTATGDAPWGDSDEEGPSSDSQVPQCVRACRATRCGCRATCMLNLGHLYAAAGGGSRTPHLARDPQLSVWRRVCERRRGCLRLGLCAHRRGALALGGQSWRGALPTPCCCSLLPQGTRQLQTMSGRCASDLLPRVGAGRAAHRLLCLPHPKHFPQSWPPASAAATSFASASRGRRYRQPCLHNQLLPARSSGAAARSTFLLVWQTRSRRLWLRGKRVRSSTRRRRLSSSSSRQRLAQQQQPATMRLPWEQQLASLQSCIRRSC